MKKDISIEDLAHRVHSVAMQIQPDVLSKLLCLLDTEEEKSLLIGYLEGLKTFQYVSILGSALRDYGQWSESLKIQKRRFDNQRQMELFNYYLDVCPVVGVPTSMLKDIFKADDDESDDEVLEVPKTDLLKKGYREIDLDLYIASCRLDYKRVEDLLHEGANPKVYFGGDSTAEEFAHREVECNLDIVYPILFGESKLNDWSEEYMLIEYAAYDKLLYKFKMYEDYKLEEKECNEYLWLKDLCEVYSHYMTKFPDKCDNIEFRFDYPECGWIDFYFYKEGKTANFVSFSDVYEPFEALKGWVEQIAKSWRTGHQFACSVCLDCERGHTILTYQPMWGCPTGVNINPNYQGDCGVLTIYDEIEKRMVLEAYCVTDEFIKSFYYSMLSFCKETSTQPEFIYAWLRGTYNDEIDKFEDYSPEQNAILYNIVKSDIIEEYLKR